MNGHQSKRGPAHVRFDRGERPFWWATGSKKVATVFRKKMTEERTSNIFSPNYSVGTALCTLECPGSGMAWWVMAGAKPRPPHIVLSVDFPHSLVSVHLWDLCPPLTLLAWRADSSVSASVALCSGWNSKNMLSQGWCGVSSTGCLICKPPSVWTTCFWSLSSSCWYKVGGKYHNSVQISVHVRSLIRCACVHRGGGLSSVPAHPAPEPVTLSVTWERNSTAKTAQHGRRRRAKHPPKAAARASCAFKNVLCGLQYFFPRKPVVDTRMSEMPANIF